MSAPSLLEQLKEKYAVLEDPLYGSCLVIPSKEFGADWENKLRAEGHKIYQGSAAGRVVFFVQLAILKSSGAEGSGKGKVVYEPPLASTKHSFLGKSWTSEEDKELIKGVTLGQKDKKIAERLPGRTPIAVNQRIHKLRKHGALPKSGRGKRRKLLRTEVRQAPRPEGEEPLTPEPDKEPEKSAPITAPAPAAPTIRVFPIKTTLTISLNINCDDIMAIQNAMRLIRELESHPGRD